MAQEGDSITLTCTEGESIPPADTTWRKGFRQEDIVPGFKYSLSEEGPVLRLTIHNVSRDDQDVYFCHSENLLGVRELEVFLTVRSESGVTVHSSYTHWYIQMEMQKDLSWTLTEFSRCRPPCRPVTGLSQVPGCAGMWINPLPLPSFPSTASSAYTGVIIGVFAAAVIVALPIVFAKLLYSNRHRICLGDLCKNLHQWNKLKLLNYELYDIILFFWFVSLFSRLCCQVSNVAFKCLKMRPDPVLEGSHPEFLS